MGTVDNRLERLGLTLPEVAVPLGSYVPAKADGRRIHTSGQLPVVDGTVEVTGKVGAEVSLEDARAQARICALNAIAAVRSAVGDLDRVDSVVKMVGFVASDPSFTQQPAVINGASDLLAEVFGEAGVHARSAVGVAVLPMDAPVEIEIVVALRDE